MIRANLLHRCNFLAVNALNNSGYKNIEVFFCVQNLILSKTKSGLCMTQYGIGN